VRERVLRERKQGSGASGVAEPYLAVLLLLAVEPAVLQQHHVAVLHLLRSLAHRDAAAVRHQRHGLA